MGQFAPHLTQLLGTVPYGQTRVLLLHTGAVLAAEYEERRPANKHIVTHTFSSRSTEWLPLCVAADSRWPFGGIGVFPLAAPLSKALGGDIVAHLPVVAHLVGLGHVLKTFLIAGRQSLNTQRETRGKLSKIQSFGKISDKIM